MAAENVQTFTDGNFDDSVLKSGAPVLVDFWAEWCGPCKRLGPTVDALATEYAGKVTIGKLNVDENPNIADQVSDPRHPDAPDLQGRPGRRVGRRARAEGRPQEGHRQAHLNDARATVATSSSSGPARPA